MRVLHLNKFAYSKGGAEEYMLQLATHQVLAGDAVGIFGARADELSTPGVETFDYDVVNFHNASGVSKLSAAREVMWSRRAQSAVAAAIQEFSPDVIHLHNYAHQLSSSVIATCRSFGIPTVNTAHDYKLVCPAYVANVNGKDCFKCSVRVSPKVVLDKCHHSDLTWSALVGAEAILVRTRRLTPDIVIAPSDFMREALQQSWLDPSRIVMVRNPATATGLKWKGGRRLLYVGRLSREKGIAEVIQSCIEAHLPLSIAGDGPLREELESLAAGADIEFLGHIGPDELARLRETCIAQVMPSAWPENAPLSALEAAVDGVPIIATARGGIPELRSIGARMVLVRDVTASQLVRALDELAHVRGDLEAFREAVSWDQHVRSIRECYEGTLQ